MIELRMMDDFWSLAGAIERLANCELWLQGADGA